MYHNWSPSPAYVSRCDTLVGMKNSLYSFRLSEDDDAKLTSIWDHLITDQKGTSWTRSAVIVWCIRKVHESLVAKGKIKP